MIALVSPSSAQKRLAQNMRERRASFGLTQADLSKQSGVALATLRKFEQTGKVSLESLLKIMAIIGDIQAMLDATKPAQQTFKSIDEVLEQSAASTPKRGRRS